MGERTTERELILRFLVIWFDNRFCEDMHVMKEKEVKVEDLELQSGWGPVFSKIRKGEHLKGWEWKGESPESEIPPWGKE